MDQTELQPSAAEIQAAKPDTLVFVADCCVLGLFLGALAAKYLLLLL